MAELEKTLSLREHLSAVDSEKRRDNIMNEIKSDYEKNGRFRVTSVDQRYIMLVGRTRTGKSTIKSLLVNPTTVPDELTLKSGTKDPLFESFHISDNRMVLNIIDTPGLFERTVIGNDSRDNKTILNTIEACANHEITKFHVVCFCVSITVGINQEDLESLKALVKFFGDEISKNSCLIITRCESKDETQRQTMQDELLKDNYFKDIEPFFKLGIFFSGSLNRDDYNKGNESLYDQFITINDYRTKLITLFTSDIEPFPISEMVISDIRRARYERSLKDDERHAFQVQIDEYKQAIQRLTSAKQNNQRTANNIPKHEEYTSSQSSNQRGLCIIS